MERQNGTEHQNILVAQGSHQNEPNEELSSASEISIHPQEGGTGIPSQPVSQESGQAPGHITILSRTARSAPTAGTAPPSNQDAHMVVTPVSDPNAPAVSRNTIVITPVSTPSMPPSSGNSIVITPVSAPGETPGREREGTGDNPVTPPASGLTSDPRKSEFLLLQARCAEKEVRIQELQRQLQMMRDAASERVQDEDLEDKDSILAALQGRVEELEAQLANTNASAQAEAERDHALAAQLAAQEALADFVAGTPVVSLPALIPSMPLNEQQQELFQRYEAYRTRLQAEEQTSVVTEHYVRELTETLEQHLTETERLRQQILEAKEERGEALQELKELNLQYQKDLHYVSFYEKLPEDKIDGLEGLRGELQALDSQLRETLKKGIVRAYAGRGTELEKQLEGAQNQLKEVLEALCQLVESDVELDPACFGDAYTAEDYRQQAKEQLARYETLLNEMNQAVEQKLKFESIIGFGGEETF